MYKNIYVDADSMVWRAGAVTTAEPASHAFHIVKQWLTALPAENTIVYLGNEDKTVNDRYEKAVTYPYKANRKQPKPKHYDVIREYLVKHHRAIIVPRQEADDYVSIGMYQDVFVKGRDSACSSIDKDLFNTPGTHYNWLTGEVTIITEDQAAYNFYKQMLMGDNSDNIKGLPAVPTVIKATLKDSRGLRKGCGIKAAEKILEGRLYEHAYFKRVYLCYTAYITELFAEELRKGEITNSEKKKLIDSLFLENANLLWIEREEFKKYTPPFSFEILS